MTEAERNEHERAAHPGEKPRKDLDDLPPELRRGYAQQNNPLVGAEGSPRSEG